VKGHREIINAIDAIGGLGIGGGAPEIVTGSRDGKKNCRKLFYVKITELEIVATVIYY
jgi:hypothetical protein